jgi:hypothetical protein
MMDGEMIGNEIAPFVSINGWGDLGIGKDGDGGAVLWDWETLARRRDDEYEYRGELRGE